MEQVDEANVGVLDERVSERGVWCVCCRAYTSVTVFGPTKNFEFALSAKSRGPRAHAHLQPNPNPFTSLLPATPCIYDETKAERA